MNKATDFSCFFIMQLYSVVFLIFEEITEEIIISKISDISKINTIIDKIKAVDKTEESTPNLPSNNENEGTNEGISDGTSEGKSEE